MVHLQQLEYSSGNISLFMVVILLRGSWGISARDHTTPQRARTHAPLRYVGRARVAFSLVALGFSLAVTFDSLGRGWTTLWDGVDVASSIFIFLALLTFVGIMEGLQVAFGCYSTRTTGTAHSAS